MTTHNDHNYNNLPPAETERLSILAEEMGECLQAIGKILRHGYESCHPKDMSSTNRELLQKELGDVLYTLLLMSAAGDVSIDSINHWSTKKAQKIKEYTHHQKESLLNLVELAIDEYKEGKK
ncbi:MazG nucleotide pyrophosphohydrolase domain-containing protein [Nitrosomonas marina]|uniref:MazG nucleotide pyrophosphohydrolase domain-containing protein n=1 Tax=Nitrosomonas marina TaxID=917 RepID=A0A1H8GL74_9PROT|nr:MazG nucleotide pyrophosphohydrolase domain-containing protein [Nitrosomonas marina]SEN44247.1 MazG nucleotide pyrophosphohydrolase domain-containing protein [Nitrosomonas marina]